MGRINGANSDYIHDGKGVIKQQTDPLFMKLYICPSGQPNPLEAPDDVCIGTNDDCPGLPSGHAMVHLNAEHGVEIMAGDQNRILVKQNGDIELGKEGGGAKITLKDDGQIIIDAGTVTINGNLTITGDIIANNL